MSYHSTAEIDRALKRCADHEGWADRKSVWLEQSILIPLEYQTQDLKAKTEALESFIRRNRHGS